MSGSIPRTASLSSEDERGFVRYIAENDPNNSLRKELGKIYEELVLNREGRWPFGPKHSAQQWFEFYLKKQKQYDRAVGEYLNEAPIQNETAPGRSGAPPTLLSSRSDVVPQVMLTPRTKSSQVTGTPSSSQRRMFTEEEEWRLAQYLAIENPAPAGRMGFQVYGRLYVNQDGRWSWGRDHTVQSWCEKYRRNRPKFDEWIDNYQRRFGIDPGGGPRSELWDSLPPLRLSHLSAPSGTSSIRGSSRVKNRSARPVSRPLVQGKAHITVLITSDSEEDSNIGDEHTLPSLTLSAKALGKRPVVARPLEDGEEDSPPPLQRSFGTEPTRYDLDTLDHTLLNGDGPPMLDEASGDIATAENVKPASRHQRRTPPMRAPQSQDSSPRLSPTPQHQARASGVSTDVVQAVGRGRGPTPTNEFAKFPSSKKRPQALRKNPERAAEEGASPPLTRQPTLKRRRADDDDGFFADLQESAHSSPWPPKKRKPVVRLEGGFGNSVFTCPMRVAQAFTNGRRTSGVGSLSPPKPVPSPPSASAEAEWPPKRRKARLSATVKHATTTPTNVEVVAREDQHSFSRPTQPKRVRELAQRPTERHHPFSQPTQPAEPATDSQLADHHPFSQPTQFGAVDAEDPSDMFDALDLNEEHHPFSQPSQAFLQEGLPAISKSGDYSYSRIEKPQQSSDSDDFTDEEAVEAAILPPELTQKVEAPPRKSDFGVQASPSKKASVVSSASPLRIQRFKGKERAQVSPALAPDRSTRRHTLAFSSSTPFISRVSPSRILGIRPRHSLPAAGPSRFPAASSAAGPLSRTSVSYAGVPITSEDHDELIQQGLETRLRGLAAETGFPLDIVNHAWRTTGRLALTRAFLLALCDHVTDTAGNLTRAFVEAAEAEGFYGDEDGPGSVSMSEERQYYPPEDSKAAHWLRENSARMEGADARVGGGESEDDVDDSSGMQTSRLLDRLRGRS